MKLGEKKPYIPIFVGSTFTDLQAYRRAVREALEQLEAIVRGMEQFGSKPGSPVDECLRIVKSCSVYIGIFSMRYGSVPDGQEKSMTHLEYDEAQRNDLPSLIYIIDEENQPLFPKHVETGSGAKKLRELKEQLKKRHMVSFFTSPDDLRARVLHDVPELLKTTIGANKSLINEIDIDEEYIKNIYSYLDNEIMDQLHKTKIAYTSSELSDMFNVDPFLIGFRLNELISHGRVEKITKSPKTIKYKIILRS